MGYKKIDKSLNFADLVLASSLKHNRSLKLMEKIDNAIDWSRVESVLMGHYVVGTSSEGADAYPPLLLFKCLMLQKWFHINSNPELENQINDRLSFKKFLSLPFSKPAPDHSTRPLHNSHFCPILVIARSKATRESSYIKGFIDSRFRYKQWGTLLLNCVSPK